MTGGQESLATGRLEQIVAGIGVPAEHIRVVNPLAKHHAENLAVLADEIAHKGVSVIIPRRACIHNKRRV
jgi:indolepyruvate ferredoxin oxidoreductase alpha subunit